MVALIPPPPPPPARAHPGRSAVGPARTVYLPYPHPGQQAVRRQARRFNWLAAGRRWRKTTNTLAVFVEAALQGRRLLWGAPVYDQVRVAWDEARRAADHVAAFNVSRMVAAFPGGGAIVFRSLDDPNNARGHTADGVAIDEAGDVKPEAWYEVIRPMLMDTNGFAWIQGTPKGRNWFWEELERARTRPDSVAWQIPTLGVLVDDGRLVRSPHPLENPHIPFAEIERLYATMPEAAFRQEILAEFVAGAQTIFDRDWFAANRYDANDPRPVNACIARWISWDTGFKDTAAAAYSAAVVIELSPEYEVYVREVWRDKLTLPYLLTRMEQLADKYRADGKLREVLIEDKASGISATQTIRETAEPWLADLIRPIDPKGASKEQRAELAAVWCRQGWVRLPAPSSAVRWLWPFEQELFTFPDGQYLDQVDAFAQAVNYVSGYLSEAQAGRYVAQRQAELLAGAAGEAAFGTEAVAWR